MAHCPPRSVTSAARYLLGESAEISTRAVRHFRNVTLDRSICGLDMTTRLFHCAGGTPLGGALRLRSAGERDLCTCATMLCGSPPQPESSDRNAGQARAPRLRRPRDLPIVWRTVKVPSLRLARPQSPERASREQGVDESVHRRLNSQTPGTLIPNRHLPESDCATDECRRTGELKHPQVLGTRPSLVECCL